MKLLDDIHRRNKLKKMLKNISSDIDSVETIDDLKSLVKKLVDELEEIL